MSSYWRPLLAECAVDGALGRDLTRQLVERGLGYDQVFAWGARHAKVDPRDVWDVSTCIVHVGAEDVAIQMVVELLDGSKRYRQVCRGFSRHKLRHLILNGGRK